MHRLRILNAVSEAGSFSGAAAALHMSQPAVSQHIAALERELNATLVTRSTRGAELTPAGQVVQRHGLAMLRTAGDVRRALALLDHGGPRLLRLAAFPSACAALIPQAVRIFQAQQPEATVTFAELDAGAAIRSIKAGEADLAMVFDYAARPLADPAVTLRQLVEDPLYVALPAGHPAAAAPVVDVTDLADEPWISGTADGCGEVLRAIAGSVGFTPRVAFESNRYPTTQALVAAGHGVALVPSLAVAPAHAGVSVRLLRPTPPPRRVWAVTVADSELAQTMIDCLAAVASHRLPEANARRA